MGLRMHGTVVGDFVPMDSGRKAVLPTAPDGLYWFEDKANARYELRRVEGIQVENSRAAGAVCAEAPPDVVGYLGGDCREPREIERVVLQLAEEQRLLGAAVKALEVALKGVVVPVRDKVAGGQAKLPGVAGPLPVTLLGQMLGDQVVGLQVLAAEVRGLAARVAL